MCLDLCSLSTAAFHRDVLLRIPEYVLSADNRSIDLTRITGGLLECLAARPNTLVTPSELKRFAWGTQDGATDHALHQQMRHLRETLKEFEIDTRVRCLRGKGYLLEWTTV